MKNCHSIKSSISPTFTLMIKASYIHQRQKITYVQTW